MGAVNPVNSNSSLSINDNLEIQAILLALKKLIAKTEAEDARLMAAVKDILSKLQGMLASNSPPTSEQISEFSAEISGLLTTFDKVQADADNELINILSSTGSKKGDDQVEESKLKKLCEQLRQQLSHMDKQLKDTLNALLKALEGIAKTLSVGSLNVAKEPDPKKDDFVDQLKQVLSQTQSA